MIKWLRKQLHNNEIGWYVHVVYMNFAKGPSTYHTVYGPYGSLKKAKANCRGRKSPLVNSKKVRFHWSKPK